MSRISDAARGRLLIVVAAALWSISGIAVQLLHADHLPALTIAAYRSLFAGIVLLIAWLAFGGKAQWDRRMLSMAACFAAMNYLFITSMTMTAPANSVLLQYSATFWILLVSAWWLGETLETRNVVAVVGGLVGIGILVWGGWQSGPDDKMGVLLGLASGLTYAGVVVHLRALNKCDSLWLATLNHLFSGTVLLGCLFATSSDGTVTEALVPGPWLLMCLALFGAVQMALPYFLFGLGLKHVNSQEAGILTLVEPVLNPLWTYLAFREPLAASTLIGGGLVVGMLVLRYLPQKSTTEAR